MKKGVAPMPSRAEAKNEATSRAARQLIDSETAARLAKTNRLRAARLAQEAPEGVEPQKQKQG
ncbi:hypothetical protein GJW-30_1_01392 [Variibacter gotjawalensis]|uniref:Uncharacterized protein n=2 Tax=Variibacter gotjawalensis TaxID=1333996 RepID=A0A0S3PSE7_9BRAD|nr:hypothetical protein EV661_3503 [Variibacter gotjawalensis]BAT58865.1 hypothetical protein GJW-30_1_01392 [Variibacter gotjawalensis]